MKVDKFYYPVDFVVLDTEPIASGPNMCRLSWEDHFLPLPMQSSIAEMESCSSHLAT